MLNETFSVIFKHHGDTNVGNKEAQNNAEVKASRNRFCGWDNFVGCGQRRDNFLGELSYHFHFSLLVSKVHFFALEASSSSSTSSFSAMFAAVQNKRQRH